MAIPVKSPIDMTGLGIVNVVNPTNPQDAATKAYVDSKNTTGIAGLTIDGGGAVPGVGSKGYLQVKYNAVIQNWSMFADVVGSAQITVKKCTYAAFPTTVSIVAAAPPNLAAAQKATDATLVGWTTVINAGDILEFVLDSVSFCTRIVLELQLAKV